MIKKMKPPVGARPGTLAIPASSPPPKIYRFTYSPDVFDEGAVADVASLADLPRDAVTWIDVQGLGSEDVLRQLGDVFAIHPLALEDVVNVPVRPKVESYVDQLLIILRMIRPAADDAREDFAIEQVSLVVGPHYVLSFQERYGDVFDSVRARLRWGKGYLRRHGADYLAYALWDGIVDAYYPVVETIGDELEEMEERVLARPAAAVLRRLNRIKRSLQTLRRSIGPQREAVNVLIRDDNPLVTDAVRVFLRDVYDHCVQTAEAIDSAREMVSGLMNLYLSVVSNRTNDVMKVLTIVASIFVPLTFMAGIYGMNFEHMPELQASWGYPALLVSMVVVGGGMAFYFYRKGWIGTPKEDE